MSYLHAGFQRAYLAKVRDCPATDAKRPSCFASSYVIFNLHIHVVKKGRRFVRLVMVIRVSTSGQPSVGKIAPHIVFTKHHCTHLRLLAYMVPQS